MPATTLSPIASAPAAMAASTPASSVTPQIFTRGRRATLAGSVGRRTRGHERAGRGGRIARPHERLADERAVEPERTPARDGRRLADPRLGDDEPVVGDELAQASRAVDVDLERAQVAVVEADQAGPCGEGALQLPGIVDLDERLETDLERVVHESRELPGRMENRQQQDEIRTGGPQHRQLDGLDDEILGQHRHGHRRPHRPKVVHGTSEPVGLAQDRDGRGATGFVGSGARHDVVIGRRDLARRGR